MRRTSSASASAARAMSFMLGAALDARLGDPPNGAHPVAWLGRLVRLLEGAAPDRDRARRWYGIAAAAALPLLAVSIARTLVQASAALPAGKVAAPAGLLALACSQRTLLHRAEEVADALEAGDLHAARQLVAWHLVSRDISALDTSGVAAAAIASVAENLSDGVVAPWLAFAVGGAPAAWAYRAVNTLDAMWGYRDGRYATLGYGAARLDDLANLAPARLTALCIALAALPAGRSGAAWQTWRRDRRRTASPNAGHPMAAMAGALGVALGKEGAYLLGGGQRRPVAADLREAIVVARRAAALAQALIGAGIVARGLR